jgi:hypothetical protein
MHDYVFKSPNNPNHIVMVHCNDLEEIPLMFADILSSLLAQGQIKPETLTAVVAQQHTRCDETDPQFDELFKGEGEGDL